MDQTLLHNEPILRLGVFLLVFGLFTGLEHARPVRRLQISKSARWRTNLGVLLIDAAMLRLLAPVSVLAAADLAARQHLGLLHLVDFAPPLAMIFSVIVLDLVIYWQHVLFHRVGWLWRLHRVHHCDADFDVTTALRFHPLEILLSLLFKMLAVVILGAPLAAVIVFEMLLNSCAMFNHSNLRLASGLDALLRRLLVTPDMHRVHHSTDHAEFNRNFGFCLSVWDRWFGTYRAQPNLGQLAMHIGLTQFPAPETVGVWRLLRQPFIR